jgi:hypothetical protein
MKALVYAGGEYLTGDEIAAALLDYSSALADAGSAGSVDIPIVGSDGARHTATFLVGPASQIVATDADSSTDELVDEEVVARLREMTRRLYPVALPVEEEQSPQDFDASI